MARDRHSEFARRIDRMPTLMASLFQLFLVAGWTGNRHPIKFSLIPTIAKNEDAARRDPRTCLPTSLSTTGSK